MIKLKELLKEAMDVPPPAIVQPHQAERPSAVIDEKSIRDAYILAATVWGESRGEGEKGMQAVLNVIQNRAGGDSKKMAGIALKPKQFSVWNGISNPEQFSKELAKKNRQDPTYQRIIRLTDSAMKGKLPDITGGAKFYFNPKKVKPSWSKKMIRTQRIGNHDFYKLP